MENILNTSAPSENMLEKSSYMQMFRVKERLSLGKKKHAVQAFLIGKTN